MAAQSLYLTFITPGLPFLEQPPMVANRVVHFVRRYDTHAIYQREARIVAQKLYNMILY
jgi:hypothetical protein